MRTSRSVQICSTDVTPERPDAAELAQIELVVFDFDGVFTDNTVYVSQDGTESVRCWRGDGLGLARLRALGVGTVVLSTEANPVVSARCRKLGVEAVQGCADKRVELLEVLERMTVTPRRTCFLGNDVNDVGCLELVGLPAVVADAHPSVIPLARLVTSEGGGRGAVRELCDLIADAVEATS